MAYTRTDIRTDVRDAFYESTADFFTDAQLNRFISQEIRSLPRKGLYLEEYDTADTVVDQLDYTEPTGTYKVETLERNWGTTAKPDWQPVSGWDNYAGAIWLSQRPTTVWTMRIGIRKSFTVLSDDSTASDIPDEKMEVVVWGVVTRAYRALIGYLKNAKNWDAIAKPDGISLSQIHAWYKEAKDDYRELVRLYRTNPKPRDINLVG